MYDKLKITDKTYIEKGHHIRKREGTNANSNNIPETTVAKLLDCKENKEIMRYRYKWKNTA